MSKSRFFPILFTFTLFLKLCHSSTCKYYISFSFLYLLLPLLDFVSQNGTQNGNGSEANPFPDMTTAINSTNDFDVTLVLFNSEVPYEFFQFFYSNITISIITKQDSTPQKIFFENGSLSLQNSNSSLTLFNIEFIFLEQIYPACLICLDLGFSLDLNNCLFKIFDSSYNQSFFLQTDNFVYINITNLTLLSLIDAPSFSRFFAISNSTFCLSSVHWNSSFAVKKSMLWFWQSNMTIVNSTFENISCNYLIYFDTNIDSVNSFTLQNINMERNNFITSALYSAGGIINLTVDSLKFNQNIMLNDVGLIIMGFYGGNMLFLNTMLFINNNVYNDLFQIAQLNNMSQIDFNCSFVFFNNSIMDGNVFKLLSITIINPHGVFYGGNLTFIKNSATAVFSLYYIENLFTPPSTWEQALSTIDFEGELAFKFNILNDIGFDIEFITFSSMSFDPTFIIAVNFRGNLIFENNLDQSDIFTLNGISANNLVINVFTNTIGIFFQGNITFKSNTAFQGNLMILQNIHGGINDSISTGVGINVTNSFIFENNEADDGNYLVYFSSIDSAQYGFFFYGNLSFLNNMASIIFISNIPQESGFLSFLNDQNSSGNGYLMNIVNVQANLIFNTIESETNFLTGVFYIWGCNNVTFGFISFLNVNGEANLISVTDTFLNIKSGQIHKILTYSSFVFAFLSSTAVLTNLNFSQFYPRLIYSSFSSMTVSNCSFSSSFEKFGVFEVCAIYFEYNISFVISNSSFDSLRNEFIGSSIYFNEISNVLFGLTSNNSIQDCIFNNNTSEQAGGAIYLFLPGDLSIFRCIFYNNYALDGSAIYYEETSMKTLILNSTYFYQNVAWENGAALFISNSTTIIIENCNFIKNIIQQNILDMGSVLFLNNPGNLSITSSIFEDNEGIMGTCIYYSETSDNVLMNLNQNIFKNNSALLGGGGIYFQNKLLSESPYQNNHFIDNTADFANDFLTYPVRLKLIQNKTFQSSKNKKAYSISVVPGITQTSLYFNVVDYYDQTIKSLNGGYSIMELKTLNFIDINDMNTRINGYSFSSIYQGQLSFENFEFQGALSSSVLLAISVNNLINIDYKTFIIESKNERIINSTYFYVIKVTFSNECNLGQYYDTIIHLCTLCQVNQFTLNQNMICEQCVDGGQCFNGILYNQAGYWKSLTLTKNIYPCAPVPENCLALNNDTNEICEIGYVGPLCQTCIYDFAKYGGKQCVPCFSKNINYTIIIAISISFIFLLCIYIKSNFNNAMNLQDRSFAAKNMILGASIKIFANYSQTIAIINTLNLNWNQTLSDIFNLHKIISGGVQQVIPLECFVKDLNLVPYLKTLLVICCPFGFCYLLMLFWIAYKMYKKCNYSIMAERFCVTTAITFFYFQPQVINALAAMFNCYQIENESYISNYPLEQCTNNERYSQWRNFVFFPAACFFVLLLPIGPLYYMSKNKERLFSKEVICKVGFLLNGYSPETFYWEFFILFKKIAIILILSFVNIGSGDILYLNNGFLILILTGFCFWIQMKWQPFITKELNSLDSKASMIVIFTIFGGLFSTISEDPTLQTALMIIIIIINLYFLVLFFKVYFQIRLTFAKESKIMHFFNKIIAEKFWPKDIQRLKKASTIAENIMIRHSMISIKKLETNLTMKTEMKKWNTNTDEKKFLNTEPENIQELDVDILSKEELKDLVKSMTAKHSIIHKQNIGLLQQIEKCNSLLLEEQKQHEELNEIQKKEIQQLKNFCREIIKELKKGNQKEDKKIIPYELELKNKIKQKTPDNSPDSTDSKYEVNDFFQKWHRDKDYFKQNSNEWQFLFKRMELHTKNKIDYLTVELTNNSSSLISFEDISITSSENLIVSSYDKKELRLIEIKPEQSEKFNLFLKKFSFSRKSGDFQITIQIDYLKNGIKSTDSLILTLEKSWFLKFKYIQQLKHQDIKRKYCDKIWKVISEKEFDEELIINHLTRLMLNNKNTLKDDLQNQKNKNNYFIKIQEFSYKELDLSFCINIKKNKKEKLKLSVRIKKNGFAEFGMDNKEIIGFIEREIYFNLFKELIS